METMKSKTDQLIWAIGMRVQGVCTLKGDKGTGWGVLCAIGSKVWLMTCGFFTPNV